jgi:transcriptional regulator of heat shock response
MDLNTEKMKLIKKIAKTKDIDILKKIKAVFEDREKKVWKELTPEQQEEINIGIQNENRGDVVDF